MAGIIVILLFLMTFALSSSDTSPTEELIPQASDKKVKDVKSKLETETSTEPNKTQQRLTTEVNSLAEIAIEPNPYTPQQVSSVYQGSTIFDGQGQKIAIITCYNQSNAQKDLDLFCKTYSYNQTKLQVYQAGSQRDSNWEMETCLDTQWSKVFAPNSTIGVFCASNSTYVALQKAIEASVKWGANIVSMSLGSSESSYASNLLEGMFSSNPKVIFLASSGDDPSVSYPSSSPNVISVGGTRLFVKSDGVNTTYKPQTIKGSYKKEGEIDWTSHRGIGSGHGISRLFPRPSYQDNANTSAFRTTPDISCISATPSENGLSIVCGGRWIGVQGTSASCPILAGMIATANSTRLKNNKKPLYREDILKALYELHPKNSPVDTMADGVGFINNRFVDFLSTLV